MKVSIINKKVALWAVLLLFPGYIFYHGLLAFSIIPDFLNGLFGIVSLFAGSVFVILYYKNYKLNLKTKYSFIVILYIGFIFIWTLIYYLFSNANYISSTSIQSFQITFLLFIMFFVGCYAPLDSAKLYQVYYYSYIILFLLITYYVQLTGSFFLSIERYFIVDNEISSYQGIARGALLMLFVLISFSKNKWNLVFLISSGLFVLFIVGARSEFYGFICALFLLGITRRKYNPKLTMMIIILFSIGLLFVFNNIEILFSSRQLSVTELSEDTSWLMRQELRLHAIETIRENPIIGNFGSHAELGSSAHYSHDVLSVWVNYGILGFLIYFGLVVWATVVSGYKIFNSDVENTYWVLSFLINLTVLILILTSKSAFWSIPGLGWGIFLAAKMKSYK